VLRGGGFGSSAVNCRSAARFSLEPDEKIGGVGFRLVCSKIKDVMPPTSEAAHYEAESEQNEFSGTVVRSNRYNASGDYVGMIGDGNFLQFNGVTVESAATYRINIMYFTDEVRQCFVAINEDIGRPTTFEALEDWQTVGIEAITVELSSGENSIRFYNDSGWCPDIDRIEIVSNN
jgi:hypothetical protein